MQNHVRRIGLYKRFSQEFHGITEKVCNIFLQRCEECHLRKAKKSIKSLVVKPIFSTGYLSRCQADLIYFKDMLWKHNMSESGIPYRWLLVYQDHFTTFIQLRPLMNKGAEEVAYFCKIFFVNSAFLTFCRVIIEEIIRITTLTPLYV
ncbi:KRAB-A domain-containing protein 2 [Oopsacas minuta]|uniref:KRAB-A domain-containing protein 2 n=1 Tax=Oopsacas minuta TaxID=111878 RepID=A0AAV7JBI2_9METZ|nr:KRAB-A domain-containing protein 2 [Oopsacas minuta]